MTSLLHVQTQGHAHKGWIQHCCSRDIINFTKKMQLTLGAGSSASIWMDSRSAEYVARACCCGALMPSVPVCQQCQVLEVTIARLVMLSKYRTRAGAPSLPALTSCKQCSTILATLVSFLHQSKTASGNLNQIRETLDATASTRAPVQLHITPHLTSPAQLPPPQQRQPPHCPPWSLP